MQRQPVPHPGPAGTFKRSTAASSRTPEAIHPDLGPPQANAKAGNGVRGSCAGPPAWARPPGGRLRAQAGIPRPPRPEAATGPDGTEGAEAARAWAARAAQERGPRARAVLATSALAAAPIRIPARRPQPPLAPRGHPQPTAQRAGSGEHQAASARGLLRRWNRTNPESSEGRGGRGRT